MLKVCFSTNEYPPRSGGVGVAARRLVRNLCQSGMAVRVVTPCDTPGAAGTITVDEEDGAIIHRLHHDFTHPAAGFAYRKLILDLDKELNFDLFHGFFLTAVYPCISAAAEGTRPRPVIASIRGNDALTLIDHPYTRRSIVASLRKAAWVTSVNQLYLDRAGRETDLAGRSSVIRNGIALPPQEAAWSLSAANRGVVGTVGQLRRVKDVPLLVRGYGGVRRALRKELRLAGFFDDPEEEHWSNILIDEFGIRSELRYTGRFPQAEVFGHLRAMHVYVQPSAFEGLPNALLEAAATGVPLIATEVGGMREILTHGEDALVVPHGDPARMTEAIEAVLADDDLAQRLSQGARRLAGRLSAEREWVQWHELYQRLTGAI